MDTSRRTARIVGAFFLIAMVTYLVGASIIDSVQSAPDYLSTVSENETQVIVGVLLEIINCVAVIGIAVAIYPIFKKYNEALALGYVGFRVIEVAVLVAAVISPLLLIELSQEYLTAGVQDASDFQVIGTLLLAARAHLAGIVLSIFFSLGALIFYYFLYRTKLVPRFISIWGLIAAVLVLTWNLLEAFGIRIEAGIILGLPIILNEIFLGFWLIAKGFDPSATVIESA